MGNLINIEVPEVVVVVDEKSAFVVTAGTQGPRGPRGARGEGVPEGATEFDVLQQGGMGPVWTKSILQQRISLLEHVLGNSGAALTVPFDLHQRIQATLNASCTLTFAVPPAPTNCRLTLISLGAYSVILPAGMFVVGTLPDLTLQNGNRLRIDAEYDGTNWTVGVSKITLTT